MMLQPHTLEGLISTPPRTSAGLFVGSSTAVNLVATVRAAREMGPGNVIVTVLCDGGQVS